MKPSEVQIGRRVRSLRDFSGVPSGTEGVIDELYEQHRGFMVAWDLPHRPLPDGYTEHDGTPVAKSGLLRDGFGIPELDTLETV